MAFNISGMPLPVISRDTAITQRPVSTSILGVDSADRYPGSERRDAGVGVNEASPYGFTITRSNNIIQGTFTRIALSEIMLQWAVPNINPQTSSIIVTRRDFGASAYPPPPPGLPVVSIITLEPGFYTPSMLATALQTAIRADPTLSLPNFTMTYGISGTGVGGPTQLPVFEYSPTGAVANPNNITVSFDPMPYSSDGLYSPTQTQLFDILGLTAYNKASYPQWIIPSTTPPPFPYVNVLGDGGYSEGNTTFGVFTKFVDIVSTQMTQNQSLRDASTSPIVRDVLARIYIADAGAFQNVLPSSSTFAPPGTTPCTLYRAFPNPKQILWRQDQPVPGVLKFEMFDDRGNSMSNLLGYDSASFTDWCMTLLVTEN